MPWLAGLMAGRIRLVIIIDILMRQFFNISGSIQFYSLFVLVILLVVKQPVYPQLVNHGHFLSPPRVAAPYVWWHMINQNITKEGITADLEAMKRAGIGGATIFDVGLSIPSGSIVYNTPEWREHMAFAMEKASGLGLEVAMHACSGWSASGGPWVVPEDAQKQVVYSEMQLDRLAQLPVLLPQPESSEEYYRDVAVFAFPNPAMERASPEVLSNWKQLTGMGFHLSAMPELLQLPVIPFEKIIDLSQKLNPDGSIHWLPPAEGNWTVLRIGNTITGVKNRVPTAGGEGLEVDKLSADAVDRFLEGGLHRLFSETGAYTGSTFTGIVIDSWEVGFQNWTHEMREEFLALMGYDMWQYMPVFAGYAVNSVNESQRFLYDYRKTLAKLIARNYTGHMAKRLSEHNMQMIIEPYGGNTHANFNSFSYGKPAHILLSENWADREHHISLKRVSSIANVYGGMLVGCEAMTTSAAGAMWRNLPHELKPYADWGFVNGVNRIYFHRFVHQPWVGRNVPGLTMGGNGSHVDRTQTWWDVALPWHQYLARCQYILQKGHTVADFLLFLGEDYPINFDNRLPLFPAIPEGYDYDYCDVDVLKQLKVDNGELVVPSGARYRMLVLPEERKMSIEVLTLIKDLVSKGAHLYGQHPAATYGLTDMEAEQQGHLDKLTRELWGRLTRHGPAWFTHHYGEGTVYYTKPLEWIANELGMRPDFISLDRNIQYIHKRTDDGDYYFMYNKSPKQTATTCYFRVSDRQPEIWNPMSGEVSPCPVWKTTPQGIEIPFDLHPFESLFVVFRDQSRQHEHLTDVVAPSLTGTGLPSPLKRIISNGERTWFFPEKKGTYHFVMSDGSVKAVEGSDARELNLAGGWDVTFRPAWEDPEVGYVFDSLYSWSHHADFFVRHFSGTAVYSKSFNVDPGFLRSAGKLELDLGEVREIAAVRINGQDLGILWMPPYRMDISGAIRRGRNSIEIEVTNSWANRLIGDEQFEDDVGWVGTSLRDFPDFVLNNTPRPVPERKTFTTFKFYGKEDQPEKAGMLGPVKLVASDRKKIW